MSDLGIVTLKLFFDEQKDVRHALALHIKSMVISLLESQFEDIFHTPFKFFVNNLLDLTGCNLPIFLLFRKEIKKSKGLL